MSLKLYEIEQQYVELANQIIDNDGEITEELEKQLKINENELKTKGQAYALIIKQFEADNASIKAEKERLDNLAKSRQKTIDKLKERLLQSMNLYQLKDITTPLTKISIRNSTSTTITDESSIPKEYMIITEDKKPDKKSIKEALQNGTVVAGAELTTNQNINIK